MDTKETPAVSLPSASQTEAQTVLEQQNLIKVPKIEAERVDKASDDKKVVFESEEEASEESESDNEEIVVIEPEAVKKSDDVNLDDEFEKIVPFKFKRLSEESIDDVDHEIAEILSDAEPLEKEFKNDREEIDTTEQRLPVIEPESSLADSTAEKSRDEAESKPIEGETKPTPIDDAQPTETIIDEEQLPKDFDKETSEEKPPVPIPTYRWEDVKRSKEQGGYPWTHLYKQPLGPDEEPEVILNYKHSPRSARKFDADTGTPKSQKKVRIQDEIEVQESEKYIQDLPTNEAEPNAENVDPETLDEGAPTTSASKSPKSILKQSQKILEPIKPKFDSGSLKKKIKNPLQRIKKMADQQFKKVKSHRTFIKKIPATKDEIVLNEELKILKLKESPKSQHREIPSYIVKQDSDETLEILDFEESPMEGRKRREVETHLVTPDEIIDLPSAADVSESDRPSEQRESTVDSLERSMSEGLSVSQKDEVAVPKKKRDHHYEDIDDYISSITSDLEHVERSPSHPETKLQRQTQVGACDPIFDEFSRELNKDIRRSLSAQDDKIRHELAKKIPKIKEIEQQLSDEDKEEKIAEPVVRQPNLLAPISSIDSTSSDEDRKAQLSIVAEESEASDSNKKKSFDDSSVDREIESLKDDGSDISTTLIEEELKTLDKKDEEHKKKQEELKEKSKEPEEKSKEPEEKSKEPEEKPAEAQPETNEKLSDDAEQNLKEDVVVKREAEIAAPVKISGRWSKMSDHEYEPIGEPIQPDENIDDLDQSESQKRKSSDPTAGAGKKLLRSPTEDSGDNISAQDFQNDIENRFFAQETGPIAKNGSHASHQENTFDEAVIIDEEPVKREVPRKRNFMTSAQEQSKSFHKKIKAQAGMFKTSLNNKMKKKPKEKPVAVEVAQEVDEPSADADTHVEIETIETVHVQSSEAAPKSKAFKMPKMPKFKKPQFKKPEMPKISLPDRPEMKMGERFSNLRKLGRSKSMKEESAATDSTSFTTPEVATAEPTKKRFDFGTYPRLIRDKFKRPKLPERSDQSVRSDTPPVLEFTKVSDTFLQRGPVASRWPEYDQDSGKYQQFNSESDLDRESSIERRMRMDYERSTEEREDFEIVKRLMNEEQRQLDEMDRENQEIHLMAQQERFKKPAVERQESDVGSEEDKMMWSGMPNKDIKDDFEEPNALRFDDGYKYSLDQYKNETDINRSYTPQTNQETQSSGSSGTRRRKGVFDDEDDYFLRENRISNEIHIGDYISSAIKEGLSSPEDNALVQMGRYEEYEGDEKREFTPEKPTRSLKRKNKKNRDEEVNDEEDWKRGNVKSYDFYKTFPPDRPTRKQKKSLCEDEDLGDEIDLHQLPDEYIDEHDMFYRQQDLKGLEHPDLIMGKYDFDNELDYSPSKLPIPPTPPRRRKKKMRNVPPLPVRNDKTPLAPQNIKAYRYEEEFVPLAQEEHFTTPTPTPRRTRSRSQMSAHTLDDADSFKRDSIEAFTIFNIQDKENGYAEVRKQTPSRPVRRKRSTKSLGERQFATMPHLKREDVTPPPRPVRNYSTIIPNKPPRRKSAGSLVEISKTIRNDDDDYEEILDHNQDNAINQRLKSGEIVSRMKDRPLPPPPRPKREHKKHKKDDDDDNKLDKDDDAERIIGPLTVDTEIEEILSVEEFLAVGSEVKRQMPRQDSDFSEPERVIEVEVSTQTDPVPDEEFACDDDEDIDIEEFLSSDGKMKTLEDILKEEQEAEMERARQLAEAENLSRGIQRFRDSSQRSMSERSRTSGDRSRSLSRPITPSAVLVEHKKSSPIMFNNEEQTLTEAGLFIHPITYDDFGRQPSDDEEPAHLDEPVNITDVNNNLETELVEHQHHPTIETQTSEETLPTPKRVEIEEIIEPTKEVEDDEFDAEMQKKIEEMIESVMNSAREEVEWVMESNENSAQPPVESIVRVEITQPEEAPLPPPRRKVMIEEPAKSEAVVEALPFIDESQIVEQEKPEVIQLQSSEDVPDESEGLPEADSKIDETFFSHSPNRLHLSSLEIDNLSVSSLLAGRITASEIDSNTIVTNEFDCKVSHNLGNSRSMEFPPGFIEEIVERVRSAERAEHHAEPTQTTESPNPTADNDQAPERPPLPTQFGYSAVPPSFYQLRDFSEDDAVHPQVTHRRRRHQPKRKDSTSEEDYQRDQRSKTRSGGPNDQSVLALGGQFVRACGSALRESGGQLMEILRASSKDENKKDLHIALIILIVIVAGLILMGMGDKSVHHHHWDFFNPPDNHGRL